MLEYLKSFKIDYFSNYCGHEMFSPVSSVNKFYSLLLLKYGCWYCSKFSYFVNANHFLLTNIPDLCVQ